MSDNGGARRVEARSSDTEEEMAEQELIVDFAKGQAEEGCGGDDGAGDDDTTCAVSIEPATSENREEEYGE